ncbi:MAG: cobalamin-dependent protein [Actinomycetota bacterium]|nr:cobalamin-dependent protein [Actinomycetota bacterium]
MQERSQHAVEEYLEAILEPDPARAREVVRGVVRAGLPIEVVYSEILGPAMVEVGRRWEANEIGVAHEHLAAEVTGSLVSELADRVRSEPGSGRMALVSCSPEERHCIGGQMLSGLLEASGWEVLYLGATLPVRDLVAMAEDEAADVIALSTTMPGNLPGVAETIRAVQELEEPPLVIVGGQAYSGEDDARRVGADAYAPSAADAPSLLRRRLPPA